MAKIEVKQVSVTFTHKKQIKKQWIPLIFPFKLEKYTGSSD